MYNINDVTLASRSDVFAIIKQYLNPDIKFTKVDRRAFTPIKIHSDDAGYDLKVLAVEAKSDDLTGIAYFKYYTGLAFEIPQGFQGELRLRSSARQHSEIMCNHVGTIDAGYTGEIIICTKPILNGYTEKDNKENIFISVPSLCSYEPKYKVGHKIAQLIITPYIKSNLIEVDKLDETLRGNKGFGSTGN